MVVLWGNILVRSTPIPVMPITHRKAPCEVVARPLVEGTLSEWPDGAQAIPCDQLQATINIS